MTGIDEFDVREVREEVVSCGVSVGVRGVFGGAPALC